MANGIDVLSSTRIVQSGVGLLVIDLANNESAYIHTLYVQCTVRLNLSHQPYTRSISMAGSNSVEYVTFS